MSRKLPAPPDLPTRMPHRADHLGRRLCRALLRLAGWHLVGRLPECGKLVVIVAPHSSWWDGIWGLLMKVAIGAEVRFMIKREVVRGPLGWLLRRLGAIPIDRRSAKGVVEQMADAFEAAEAMWLVITPEGTRAHVERWKSGFWHIASRADVAVFPIAFHYPDKAIHLGEPRRMSGDKEADLAQLRAFYEPFQGKHHGL